MAAWQAVLLVAFTRRRVRKGLRAALSREPFWHMLH